MSARRRRNQIGFQNLESAWAQLIDTCNGIELSQRFTKGHIKRIEKITADEKTKRTGASLKQHKFLRRVLAIDSDCYKLCVVTFSQNQIDSTKAGTLDKLVERIRERRDDIVNSPTMRLFLDRSGNHMVTPLPQATNQLSNSPSEPWVELKYAERAGIEKVFGQYLLDRIENTDLSKNWKAVVMRLPMWPPDLSAPCSMSLDLREESVKEVTMALFQVEVTWTENAFRVVHENGLLQIIPYSQYTMKGVLDEDILKVFGTDIHAAITTCSIRMKELSEGDRRTKCVSITFSERRAKIDLTLSVLEGVKIQKKLSSTTTPG